MFSTKILAVLALIAAVCFVAVVAVQYLELSSYSAAPSVWATVQ